MGAYMHTGKNRRKGQPTDPYPRKAFVHGSYKIGHSKRCAKTFSMTIPVGSEKQ
jgi:hypothetical protein